MTIMITKYLQERFVLSEKGTRDLKRGIFFSTLQNIGLMIPICYLFYFLTEYLDPAKGGEPHSLTFYILLALGLMIVMYVINRLQYDSTYTTVFGESARRRITLAEKLRRLPLAFFAERNLSDLTSTVMEDCTQLEQTFSHAVPPVSYTHLRAHET